MPSLSERCHPFSPFGGLAIAAASHETARALGVACVPQLEILAAEGSTAMRAFAVLMLAELEPPRADERASEVLERERETEVRVAAIESLRWSPSPIVPKLVAMLADASFPIRDAAACTLAARSDGRERIGELIDEGHPAGLELLKAAGADAGLLWRGFSAGDPAMRAHAARELARSGVDLRSDRRLLRALGADFVTDRAWDHLRAVSAALIESDPALALDELGPLLAPSALGGEFERERGRAIAFQLYGAIADACDGLDREPGRLAALQPFRPIFEAVGASAPDQAMRSDAVRAMAAFRWADGERDPLLDVDVDLGEGDDEPFPFFVVGWREFPSLDEAQRRALAPLGMFTFRHQTGGYACSQSVLCGYALLPPDAIRARLRVRAQGYETSGEALPAPELAEWSAEVAALGAAPFVDGVEALIATAPMARRLDALHGLDVLSFRASARPWEGIHYYGARPRIDVVGRFDAARDGALERLGQSMSFGSPRLMLLWGNSD